jgi:hypothetical protein
MNTPTIIMKTIIMATISMAIRHLMAILTMEIRDLAIGSHWSIRAPWLEIGQPRWPNR